MPETTAPQGHRGLLTPAQAAAFLGTTEGMLKRWRYKQRGPAYVKYGRVIRYTPQALIVFTQVNTIQTSTPTIVTPEQPKVVRRGR